MADLSPVFNVIVTHDVDSRGNDVNISATFWVVLPPRIVTVSLYC